MRKKILTVIVLAGLALYSLTGCQQEEAPDPTEAVQDEASNEASDLTETVQDEASDEAPEETAEEASNVIQEENVTRGDTTAVTCSLCQVEKVCGIYTAEGQEYLVCHDCSGEFVYAFEEVADRYTCSGCQTEKICATYILDGSEYIVCPDCYGEFATGMGLIFNGVPDEASSGVQEEASCGVLPEASSGVQEEAVASGDTTAVTCSLCQVEKVCGIYTAEGQEYLVCHDCSGEFVYAFEEVADRYTCTGCQTEKICATYILDGSEYIVCPDCYGEFATGMGLM